MFLTVPTTIVKGSEFIVQISIPNLISNNRVKNDDYFSNRDNWSSFSLEWNDPEVDTDQKALATVDFTGQTGIINVPLRVSSEYKSDFLKFVRFAIYDKANGFLQFDRRHISPPTAYDMEF